MNIAQPLRTVAMMSPGDMGHAVGRELRSHGLRVVTCLRGRSSRTAGLAAAAGIEDLPDEAALVREADALLAILVPAQAVALAGRIAAAVRAEGKDLLYVDCNAVAPQTVRRLAATLIDAGARVVDAGIIGGPPLPGRPGPRIYASGLAADVFAQLREYGLDVRVIGAEVGQASGLKMCYGALTKGLTALAMELLVAGQALGLAEPLRAELTASQPELLGWITRQAPGMPPKAQRWVGEMEEIAATFASLGLTPQILAGAADLYRAVAATPLGAETPEGRQGRTLDELVALLAAGLVVPE